MSPGDFLGQAGGDLGIFIADHFDNFYTYYFASGLYRGRSMVYGAVGTGQKDRLVEIAAQNLSHVDLITDLKSADQALKVLSVETSRDFAPLPHLNRNADSEKGHLAIQRWGALDTDGQGWRRVLEYTSLDYKLLEAIGLNRSGLVGRLTPQPIPERGAL
jgi:hypothetical protein